VDGEGDWIQAALIVSNWISGRKDLTEGLNTSDLLLSMLFGGASAGMGSLYASGVQTLGQVIYLNAVLGFDQTLFSQAWGDRRPEELALNTATSAMLGPVDWGGYGKGSVAQTGVVTAQNLVLSQKEPQVELWDRLSGVWTWLTTPLW
jgi:hypothetical protein